VGEAIHGSLALELMWTFIPLGITMVMFVWGAQVFFHMTRPPKGAMEIYVVGKQWMWKAQHMDGAREINELHVPNRPPGEADHGVGRRHPQLLHPRVPREGRRHSRPPQHDVVHATKPGRYHLFCTQYCGTKHSAMIGWVTAMEPAEYEAWLGGGGAGGTMADAGAKLFQDLACATVSPRQRPGPRSGAEGRLRQAGHAPDRPDRDGRRRLHP
jgi:cytochrome c oxidase subunit 2